ncbi:phage tail tape measure protein [Rahnella victoriana]|uniref:Phage tail tape measure protein n=1 Tax=Rahnella victoriana TaxID=1510570 RepID=A0ABS0DQG0_9GAMM|nr:phage tail tape measure protein [Rahnella victoriana]MBF7956126.1 phage tail tape measure protein [Rahnella victoriana]
MSDVASLSVALHLNSATFKSQITDAYQKAGQASKKFNDQATSQANELSDAIAKTVSAAKNIGGQTAGADQFSGATRGAGQLNFVLHEVAAGSNVASSTIINALIPAVHSLKGQLDGSTTGWQAQQEAAKNAAAELASAAQAQIAAAQAEKQAAINKAAIAEKTIVAAQAQRDQAIALDEYYAKQTEVNKLYGLSVSYQDEHLKNERAIIEANRLEASGLDKLKAAKASAIAADLAETEGKATLVGATEAAAAANTQLSVTQRVAATSSRAISSALSLLGGPVGIGLSVLAAGGAYLYGEFKKAEEQTKKLTAAVLDLHTSSLVSATDLEKLNSRLGDTEASVDAVTSAAKAGFSGQLLTDVATLANAYAQAGGNAQELVNSLSSLRGDPVAAMEKLTASGVALSSSVISQVLALNQRGDAAQASQILIDASIQSWKGRLSELGIEVDKTSDSVNNLGQMWLAMANPAGVAIDNVAGRAREAQKNLASLAGTLQADIQTALASAQNARIKNSAGLKNYLDAGTTATEKRAAAIKNLNNSLYSPGSSDYQRILKGINDEYEKATKKRKTGAGESEGQRTLEQAQQRNAVLREQALTTDKMTESQSQLAAFDQKIAGLKGQTLSVSQQSLVNMQGQIRAQMQSNVQLEKEAALRKVSQKYQEESRKWTEEADAMQREAAINLGKYSLSDSESADADARNAIINRFNQRRIALEKDFTDKSSTEYQARLADLENAKQRELQITEQTNQDKLTAEQDYSAGFRRGTINWVDSARDANSQMASFSSGLFDSMTDSLANFATTGKFSFRSFTTSILSDLAKISARIALSSALQGILGSAGAFIGAGATATAGASSSSGFTTGAYSNLQFNAKGGVYESPGLSAYSNSIVSSPTMFAFAKGAGLMGEAGPEAIMPLTRAANGSLGVRSISDGRSSGGTTYIQVDAPVTIVQSEGAGDSSGAGTSTAANQLKAIVQTTITERLRKEISPGGILYSSSR